MLLKSFPSWMAPTRPPLEFYCCIEFTTGESVWAIKNHYQGALIFSNFKPLTAKCTEARNCHREANFVPQKSKKNIKSHIIVWYEIILTSLKVCKRDLDERRPWHESFQAPTLTEKANTWHQKILWCWGSHIVVCPLRSITALRRYAAARFRKRVRNILHCKCEKIHPGNSNEIHTDATYNYVNPQRMLLKKENQIGNIWSINLQVGWYHSKHVVYRILTYLDYFSG